jgi:hypothetical protein
MGRASRGEEGCVNMRRQCHGFEIFYGQAMAAAESVSGHGDGGIQENRMVVVGVGSRDPACLGALPEAAQ